MYSYLIFLSFYGLQIKCRIVNKASEHTSLNSGALESADERSMFSSGSAIKMKYKILYHKELFNYILFLQISFYLYSTETS